MKKVTLGLSSSREAVNRRFLDAWEQGQSQDAFIGFETAELLWKTLTLKRWRILKVMTGVGALSIREVARRAGRDVKAVHGDISALLLCGVLEKTDGGQVIFPYDMVHVDFMLDAA
jgi:predicted transcriptional regulator